MDKKVASFLKYLLWGAVAVVLLYFSFRSVRWADFAAALTNCRWGYVLLSMVLGAMVFLVRGLRWRMQLLPIDPKTSGVTCWNAYNICMLVNLVLPRVGEVVRCAYVTRHSSRDSSGARLASMDKVFGTVVVDRVWDALSLVIVFGVLLLTMWDRFGAFFEQSFSSGISLRGGFVWIFVLLVCVLVLAVYLSWKFRAKGGLWGKLWKIIRGFSDGLSSCLRMRRGWLFIVYTALIWILYWLMCATVMWALQGIDPSAVGPELAESLAKIDSLTMADALFLMFAGAMSSIIPVPGGFGAFHTVVAGALLSIYGIPFPVGLIFATLSHESQVVTDAVCGVVSYLAETVRK